MTQIFSVILTENELLYVLVLSGVEDEEKYEDYDLNIEDTSKDRLEDGRQSLKKRDLIHGDGAIPQLDDTVTALVNTTIIGNKNGAEYTDEDSGLSVQFVKEEGTYVFRGIVE